MAPLGTVDPHLTIDELRARFGLCRHSVEKIHLQAILLRVQGNGTTAVADICGYKGDWVRRLVRRYNAEGPDALQPLKAENKRIFLDLKLHDIPRTVERAVRSAARHGVDLLTVHASGGRAMLEAAAKAAAEFGEQRPRLLAITALTSLDQADLSDIGVERSVSEHAAALAQLAISSGIDGIVCSPLEAAAMREALGPDALIVTPGVRPAGGDVGDQKRVATPAAAAKAGATHLVIGRPILQAPNPAQAAKAIAAELSQA